LAMSSHCASSYPWPEAQRVHHGNPWLPAGRLLRWGGMRGRTGSGCCTGRRGTGRCRAGRHPAALGRQAHRQLPRRRSRRQAPCPHPQAHRPERPLLRPGSKPSTLSPPARSRSASRILTFAASSTTCAPSEIRYKQAADALARALNVLTIENDGLRRKTNRMGQPQGPRPLLPLHPIATVACHGHGF
jgi:hypothetical protein